MLQKGVYLCEQGHGSGRNPNKMYVSTNIGSSWTPMEEFCSVRPLSSFLQPHKSRRNFRKQPHTWTPRVFLNLCLVGRSEQIHTRKPVVRVLNFQKQSGEEYNFLVSQLNLFDKVCLVSCLATLRTNTCSFGHLIERTIHGTGS